MNILCATNTRRSVYYPENQNTPYDRAPGMDIIGVRVLAQTVWSGENIKTDRDIHQIQPLGDVMR